MDETTIPRGMATANYWADDVAAARDWYAQVLGIAPYFAMPPDTDAPSYVEFRVGRDGDELGIVDRRFGGPAGAPRGGGAHLGGGGGVAPRAGCCAMGRARRWRRPTSGSSRWERHPSSPSRNRETTGSSPRPSWIPSGTSSASCRTRTSRRFGEADPRAG